MLIAAKRYDPEDASESKRQKLEVEKIPASNDQEFASRDEVDKGSGDAKHTAVLRRFRNAVSW
jgi:hypothetical protein